MVGCGCKMIIQLSIFIILYFHKCNGVIYHLNESEHERMPPIYHVDPYEPCMQQGGIYCSVDMHLVSHVPSELFTMIQEYSAHKLTHFDHSYLHYGICVTTTCKHLQTPTNVDQRAILEECLNESMWRNYKLQTEVTTVTCNDAIAKHNQIDTVDVIVAVVCVILLLLNVVGSLQEFWIAKSNQGFKFLSCFSIVRNGKALVAHSKTTNPRVGELEGFDGMRAITTVVVLSMHAAMPVMLNSNNTRNLEEMMYEGSKYVSNSVMVVQTFFVLSGFLLVRNLQLSSEKVKVTLLMLPRNIFLRWLRLAPPCVLVLAISSTWLRFTRFGRLWQTAIGISVSDCRRDWWLVLLYANNYIDNSQCMAETWYLAADMQLRVVGFVVYALARGRVRAGVLALLVVAGTILPAAHTYLQDLDTMIFGVEDIRHLFINNPTFNHIYKRGHTNIPGYIIGMAAGLLVYHWQKTDFDIKKSYPKFRYVFWLMVPSGVALLLSGSVFYEDVPRPSVYVRALWAGVNKTMPGLLIGVIVVGLAFKVDKLYCGILSWRGWAAPARLSYCAYVLHILILRVYMGTTTTLTHGSIATILLHCVATVTVSFLVSVPVWLLVETPVTNAVKLLVSRTDPQPKTLDGNTKTVGST